MFNNYVLLLRMMSTFKNITFTSLVSFNRRILICRTYDYKILNKYILHTTNANIP